jgi:hypothetical protein
MRLTVLRTNVRLKLGRILGLVDDVISSQILK